MAVSYYLRPKEPKKLLLVDGGRHDPNFVTLCNWQRKTYISLFPHKKLFASAYRVKVAREKANLPIRSDCGVKHKAPPDGAIAEARQQIPNVILF